jgi:hypothetical protein
LINTIFLNDLASILEDLSIRNLDKTLLICSSQSSKNQIEKRLKEDFQFTETAFITEKDFKKQLFTNEFTQLEDIKRYVCLYQSIPASI